MPIVFSAIVPHAPILIPAIGKENLDQIKKTQSSYQELEQDLYASAPDSIIIISPHGLIQPGAFTINSSPEFKINFENFGDFTTTMELPGDIGLAYKIKENLETKAPLQLITEEILDHGTGVPLYLLTKNIKSIKIIPLYYSGLDLKAHFEFGQLLKRELLVSKERIAVIASGDLSHKLTKNAPAGYSPKAAKFDKKLIEYLKNEKAQDILSLNETLIVEAGECGLKSIIILLGILDGIQYTPEMLSYEAPFGVGYLTMNFKL